MGGPPGGGGADMAGKKPLVINTLNVWETLKKIFGMDADEKSPEMPDKPSKLQHLQS
jgi:hypothetical protein